MRVFHQSVATAFFPSGIIRAVPVCLVMFGDSGFWCKDLETPALESEQAFGVGYPVRQIGFCLYFIGIWSWLVDENLVRLCEEHVV